MKKKLILIFSGIIIIAVIIFWKDLDEYFATLKYKQISEFEPTETIYSLSINKSDSNTYNYSIWFAIYEEQLAITYWNDTTKLTKVSDGIVLDYDYKSIFSNYDTTIIKIINQNEIKLLSEGSTKLILNFKDSTNLSTTYFKEYSLEVKRDSNSSLLLSYN